MPSNTLFNYLVTIQVCHFRCMELGFEFYDVHARIRRKESNARGEATKQASLHQVGKLKLAGTKSVAVYLCGTRSIGVSA